MFARCVTSVAVGPCFPQLFFWLALSLLDSVVLQFFYVTEGSAYICFIYNHTKMHACVLLPVCRED